MRYKNLQEQTDLFLSIIKENQDLMIILDYVTKLQLPNFYIAAGSIFQTIWNYQDGRPLNYEIKDIDIIYFDSKNLSKDSEQKLEDKITRYFLKLGLHYKFDVHNQARMHLWKMEKENIRIEPYRNAEDAIDQWIVTCHAIGITKENDRIFVYAPYGLSDIFSRTIRPIKHKANSKELYQQKVTNWKMRFSNLNIIEW